MAQSQQPEQGSFVRTENRGVTLQSGKARGRVTGERAVRQSREIASVSKQTGESMVDRIHEEYGVFASEAVKKLAEENVQFHPEFNGDANKFAQEVIGPNWYARMLAFNELTGSYNFSDVTEATQSQELMASMLVGISESGTVYMFGPHTMLGRQERGSANGDTDGLFAFRYIDGRQGGVSRTDGSQIPVEVGARTPNHNARVFVYEPVEFVEETTGNVVKTEWQRDDATAIDVPLEGTSLTVSSYTQSGENKKIDTSALLKVAALQNPTDVTGLFEAFGEAAAEIDRQTLKLSREEEEAPRSRRRSLRTIVLKQSGEEE